MKKRLMSTALMAVVLFTLAFMTPALAPAVYAHPTAVTVTVTGLIETIIEANSNHKGNRITAGAGTIASFSPFEHELFCEPGKFFSFGESFSADTVVPYSSPGFKYRDFNFKSDSMTFLSIDWIAEITFTPAAGITCTIERFNFRVEFNPDETTRTEFNHFAAKDFEELRGNSGKVKESFERHQHNIVFDDLVAVAVSDAPP